MTDPELANDLRQLPLFEALWHYIEKTSHGGVAYEQLRQRYRAWDIRRLSSDIAYRNRPRECWAEGEDPKLKDGK